MVIECQNCHRRNEFPELARPGTLCFCGWTDCRKQIHLIFPLPIPPKSARRALVPDESKSANKLRRHIRGTKVIECRNPSGRRNNRTPDSPACEYRCSSCKWMLNDEEHRAYLAGKEREEQIRAARREELTRLKRQERWWK